MSEAYVVDKNLGQPLLLEEGDLPQKNADGEPVVALTDEQIAELEDQGYDPKLDGLVLANDYVLYVLYDLPGDFPGSLSGVRHLAPGHGDSVVPEDLLGLVLVNLHGWNVRGPMSNGIAEPPLKAPKYIGSGRQFKQGKGDP